MGEEVIDALLAAAMAHLNTPARRMERAWNRIPLSYRRRWR